MHSFLMLFEIESQVDFIDSYGIDSIKISESLAEEM